MYGSFAVFSVSDERELRDPARIRMLDRKRNTGTRIAAAVLSLAGLGGLALAEGGIYVKLASASAPPEAGWVMRGVGLFFGLMTLCMTAAF